MRGAALGWGLGLGAIGYRERAGKGTELRPPHAPSSVAMIIEMELNSAEPKPLPATEAGSMLISHDVAIHAPRCSTNAAAAVVRGGRALTSWIYCRISVVTKNQLY